MLAAADLQIVSLDVRDVRFPTSLGLHGSDAMHTDPDYSCAYVTIATARGTQGHGLTFTLGRGTEVVVQAVSSMKYLVIGQNAEDIFSNFGSFWRKLTSESQFRWIGPEKGVIHLATAAIINGLWDLWSKIKGVPLWRLLVDLEPEVLVSAIDFRYITDVVTPEQALTMLKSAQSGKEERIKNVMRNGYPAYTTQVGWLGYSPDTVKELCKKYMNLGFTAFKLKVGQNLENDIQRCKQVREIIGQDKTLMVDANQNWDVNEAISWVQHLAEFNLLWIEEPTSPDDILGHAAISNALKPLGVGVATGEMCANRVMFKQFLQSGAMQFCQIDAARIGGVNEILSVYLMAKKLNVKVCPHAGGVGLCEMVQHLQIWDYVSLSQTMDERMIEYVDQQHEHFVHPAKVENARYVAPSAPGYSTEFVPGTIDRFEYPGGSEWERMFKEGLFKKP